MAPTANNNNGNKKRGNNSTSASTPRTYPGQPNGARQASGSQDPTSIIVSQRTHKVQHGRVTKAGNGTRRRNPGASQGPVGGNAHDEPEDFEAEQFVSEHPDSSDTALASLSVSPGEMPKPDDCTAIEMARGAYGPNFEARSHLAKRLASFRAARQPFHRRLEKALNLQRPSNGEAVLVHIVRTALNENQACTSCRKGNGPWKSCVILPGNLCGACANCWFNASGSRCSYHDNNVPKINKEPILRWNLTPEGMQLQPFQPAIQVPTPAATQPMMQQPIPQYTMDHQATIEQQLGQLGDLADLIPLALHNTDPMREIVGKAIRESVKMGKRDRLLARVQHKVEELGFVLAEYQEYRQTAEGQIAEYQAAHDAAGAPNGHNPHSPPARHEPEREHHEPIDGLSVMEASLAMAFPGDYNM